MVKCKVLLSLLFTKNILVVILWISLRSLGIIVTIIVKCTVRSDSSTASCCTYFNIDLNCPDAGLADDSFYTQNYFGCLLANLCLFICCASLCLSAVEMTMFVTSSFCYMQKEWLYCTAYTEGHVIKTVSWAFGTPCFMIQGNPLFYLCEHPHSWNIKPSFTQNNDVWTCIINSLILIQD